MHLLPRDAQVRRHGRRSWRRRLAATAAAAALTAAGLATAGTAAAAATTPFVYVANFSSGTVTAYDAATGTVAATIPVGSLPVNIAATPDGTTAYVPNLGDNTVSVISTATNTVTATITAGADPADVAVTPDGATAYVTNNNDNTVSVISTATGTVTATIPVGAGPQGVAVTPNGTTAYVTNTSDNTVSVISTATNTVTATIPVGAGPFGVAVSMDGATAYVANSSDTTVSVISTATSTVTSTISGFSGPSGLATVSVPSAAPVVTGISPGSGPKGGGTSVTITGSGFTGATAVHFGTVAAASFTVNSDTSITATAPAAASTGAVDVTVTSPAGTSAATTADRYTYIYAFTGFQSPVDNPPTINRAHAGQAIPMKFSLGGNQGLTVIAAGYPTATQVNCASGVPVNTATMTDTAGGSGLQYDPGSGTYTYVWKTAKTWAGTCQQFNLTLTDGTSHTAVFQFT